MKHTIENPEATAELWLDNVVEDGAAVPAITTGLIAAIRREEIRAWAISDPLLQVRRLGDGEYENRFRAAINRRRGTGTVIDLTFRVLVMDAEALRVYAAEHDVQGQPLWSIEAIAARVAIDSCIRHAANATCGLDLTFLAATAKNKTHIIPAFVIVPAKSLAEDAPPAG